MDGAGLGRGAKLLGERGLKPGYALVERLELGLLGGGKLGSGVDELAVIDVEKPGLLGVEVELDLTVVKRLEALEQLLVEKDVVGPRIVGRPQRRGLCVRRLQDIVAVRALDRQEREIGPLEQLARPLHCDDGVGEGRRRGVVGNARDLGFLLGNSGEQRGQIVAAFDPGEVG